jgi:two-component system response regulator FlrC
MNRLLDDIREIANSRASVFIHGESGTGKELFARHIHRCSDRKDKPFLAVNCAALPETLMESELFGYEKGAFTGASARKKGKFEAADKGTILLDEISELDYQLQSKLLRVLQEKEIDRVGGTESIPVDVRIIATTNRNIEKQIQEEKFREDLYYRLNIIPVHLPPLRERKDDIPVLIDFFLRKYNKIEGKAVKNLTEEAIRTLMEKPWKGNIRELENTIERAILMCKGNIINEEGLLLNGRPKPTSPGGYPSDFLMMPEGSLRELEKKVIFQTLDRTNGNRTHAADMLGISVRTLRNKLNEYRQKMTAS